MRRDDYRRGSQPRCICNPLTGVTCATHAEQSRAAAQGRPMVDDTAARAAGWVPLADVLDALRDWKAFSAWYERRWGESRHGAPSMDAAVPYLAERFAPTTPEGADERNGHG